MDNDVYYSTVYSWFDKTGIIANIRTHLRQNLVNALKHKDCTLPRTMNPPRTAKQYVYDLLIAEYLYNHNYAYTLSVFTSEAPSPMNFNQPSSNRQETDPRSKEKLRNDYVQHTLESLGIKPEEPKGRYITSEYTSKDTSLLLCILQCLKSCLFPDTNSKRMENPVERLVCRDEGTQTQFDCEECKKLSNAKTKLFRQKEEFDSQLKGKESQLKQQALVTEQQLVLLREKMEQAQGLMHTLNAKEKHLSEKKKKEDECVEQKQRELKLREEFLSQQANRLESERDSYKQFEGNLKRLQEELTKMKRDLSSVGGKASHETRDMETQTDFPSVENWNESSLLQEKRDLSNLVQEQQDRIEQLTFRTVQLSRQLEEMQLVRSTVRFSNASVVISESSSTEDILQDARSRLKRLEEESIKADKRYHDYISMSSN